MDLFLINLKQTVLTVVLVLKQMDSFCYQFRRLGQSLGGFSSRLTVGQKCCSLLIAANKKSCLNEAIKDMVFMVCLLYSRLRGYANLCC